MGEIKIEPYRHLCGTKSGEIAVDQHMVYLNKQRLTARLASKLGSGSGIKPASKTHAQIQISTIREAEVYPAGKRRNKPRIILHYFNEGKPESKTVDFADVGKGGEDNFQAFLEYLRNKEVTIKVIGSDPGEATREFKAVKPRPSLKYRLRWILPVLAVLFVGLSVVCFIYGQHVYGGLFIIWMGFFIYKFFYGDF
ncbi:MAG: hypothetical protein ACYS8W_04365 [Planctomycetota bacterium]